MALASVAMLNGARMMDDGLKRRWRVKLPGTEQFILASSDAAGEYLIQVAIPTEPAPASGYAVLYLLDGNARLGLLQAARDTLTPCHSALGHPPLLIVAIGYPENEPASRARRTDDLTPASGQAMPSADRWPGDGGHAARFLRFLQTRLKPAIYQRYTVDASREAIFGHSFGGLFVLYALLTHPESFTRYIAISPSLWWYGDAPLDVLSAQYLAANQTVQGTPLMLGVGEDEQPKTQQPGDSERTRTLRERAMVNNAESLAWWLATLNGAIELRFSLYPHEDHGSVMWPAARAAIEFLSE